MSGTSLDGVDLVYVSFTGPEPFELIHFSHIPYAQKWIDRLSSAHELSGLDLKLLERDYSEYTAQLLCNFIEVHRIKADFIGCHGHTIFHQPSQSITHIQTVMSRSSTSVIIVCAQRRRCAMIRNQAWRTNVKKVEAEGGAGETQPL